MACIPVQLSRFVAASDKPVTTFQIYEPMVSTACAVASFGLSILTKFLGGSNPLAIGFAACAVLPGLFHGRELYTNWIPKMLWTMPKGEVIRGVTGVPNVKFGLAGWQENSIHSNHFDEKLADALVGLCYKHSLSSSADFDCAGKRQYAEVLKKAGIDADGFDFSVASVNKDLKLAKLSEMESVKKYDLVTSFEVMSKTLPGDEENFVKKLVNATKNGGMIAMSCAIPGQPGPNFNNHTNEEVIEIFKRNGCTYNEKATCKLRHSVNPMHIWLPNSIMVFDKS